VKPRSAYGFTLIELMVSLVVAGMLMGVLVGLSGSVQRSFGYSKEITELQSNMRFAMKIIADDLTRISFMTDPDPNSSTNAPLRALDRCPPPPANIAALDYVPGTGETTMRGNYISSRDYLLQMNAPMTVLCRNGRLYDKNAPDGQKCGVTQYEPNDEPFYDGPGKIEDTFCPGQTVRMEVTLGNREFCYYTIQAVDSSNNVLQFAEIVNRDMNAGAALWINPTTRVNYQVVQAPYTVKYPTGTDARFRWVLQRDFEGCNQGQLTLGQPMEVAEFLLPYAMGGYLLEQIIDEAPMANLGGLEWQPDIGDDLGDIQELQTPVPLERLRALVVTLRGRLEYEDPKFTIQGYTDALPYLNFGVDLDGEPTNGLARVRVERTVVNLRNLAL